MRKIKTALFLRAEQVRILKQIAASLDVSVSHLIRTAIDDLIKKYKK